MNWDRGVQWYTDLVAAPTVATLDTAFVRDSHLRTTNGDIEDAYIERLIAASTRMGERATRRAWMEQTRALVMDRFPCGGIELPWPPLLEVLSIVYVDADGTEQTLDPSLYQVMSPSGPTCRKGVVAPVPDQVWPTTQSGALEAVTVEYKAGYVRTSVSPHEGEVPADLLHGQLLVIGEMYKQRSESVIGFGVSINPAYRTARDIWREYRVP